MTTSMDEEKTSKYPFMKKKKNSAHWKQKFLSLPESINEKPTATIMLNGELWNPFYYDKEQDKNVHPYHSYSI